MIRAEDRVAKVLAQDERLLDVFVAASPVFEKLRSAAMRKTMARMVTVAQAARIAGIDSAALVERLNRALDGDAPAEAPIALARPSVATAGLPVELRDVPPESIIEVDVREDLRAGKEPFRRILDAARALPATGVLRVRAIFEPAPLYAVLARYGLVPYTERLADDDWRVWFHHGGAAPAPPPGPAAAAPDDDDDDDVVVLDVRGLEPPEPMVRTLAALAALPRGKTLVQLNVRVPRYLLPKLEERGFTYELREQSPELVRLFIRHAQP